MYGQQSGDQFQTLNDQVLTYSFSTNVHSTALSPQQKPRRKNQEKLSLNIIKPSKNDNENNASTLNDKFHKRSMYTNQGKIIKIGDALFKSNFECGNLGQVQLVKGSNNTYKITTQKQINSNRSSGWFYFRCQGLKGQVNFIISGFTKSSSLYNEGMKVCYREVKKDQHHSHQNNHFINNNGYFHHHYSEWHRGGTRISYVGNYNTENDQNVFELRFTHNFVKNYETHHYPTVQFAYCYPYGFKRVNHLVKAISKKYGIVLQSLGKTYEGRDIPMLTLGNQNARKSIVLSARVHPGETVSSFIMEGFLKQLISDSEFATELKQKYLFKIVPMINPDGVVRGNYRFSAAGYDLNRRWKHCYQSSHPQIYYLKNMIKKLHRQKKVLMYIDIHGHSRKKNLFFYGCCPTGRQTNSLYVENNPNIDQQGLSKPQQFPHLMQKLNPNFKYEYCTFNMSKDKQGTARITMCKQLHIDHVYTLQSSFCGNVDGNHNYTQKDYMNMGRSLLQGISLYFYQKKSSSARESTMAGSTETNVKDTKKPQKLSAIQKLLYIREQAKQQLKSSPYLMTVGMNGSDSGSDSQPQAGIIPQSQRQIRSTTLYPQNQNDKYQRLKTPQIFNKSKSPNFINNKSIQINIRTAPRKKNRLTPEQLKNLVDEKLESLKTQEQDKFSFQKRIIAKTVNNFYSQNSQQLDSLTTDSLMKRNQRVHSKKQSNKSMLQKLKSQRINSQNPVSINIDFINENDEDQEQQDEKRRIQSMARNLLKTRQGAQYRRVKKIAQQLKRKNNSFHGSNMYQQPPIPMVRGIITVNNQLNIQKKRIKSIAPSFYPQSQQKNRRFSVQAVYRNNANFRSGKIPLQFGNKKLFINGDDISVHCKGTKIYL